MTDPTMTVPFIDLQRFEPSFLDRWTEICRRITAETRFVGGPEATRLEASLARQAEVAAVVGCANGTDALQLALRAVGVGPGDIVLIPDATFWATFEAVVNCGARVVTVDIDPRDLQMDFELFRGALDTFNPKAAILAHLYGWGSARLDDFRQLCHERQLPLIEDGAQAFGVSFKGRSIYHDAFLSTVSFYPAKVLGSCGDAGAVYCSTHEQAEVIRSLGNHGRSGHYEHSLVGWNSRLGGFDAAYLNLCLEHAEERLQSRRRLAERYRQRLPELGVNGVAPPKGYIENGYLNVTLHDPSQRSALEALLGREGIGFGIVYPGAMSKQPAVNGHLAATVGGEHAARLAESILNLPLFAYMSDAELERVLAVIELGQR